MEKVEYSFKHGDQLVFEIVGGEYDGIWVCFGTITENGKRKKITLRDCSKADYTDGEYYGEVEGDSFDFTFAQREELGDCWVDTVYDKLSLVKVKKRYE